MRKRIDAMEKTVKEQGESAAADRQKLLNEEKRLQDALDALNRAARKSGADLAVDLEKAQNDLAQIRGTLEVIGHRLDAADAQNAERDKKIDANAQAIAQKQKEAQAARPAEKTALYALGRQKLELGDEAGARQLFADFVQRYKND